MTVQHNPTTQTTNTTQTGQPNHHQHDQTHLNAWTDTGHRYRIEHRKTIIQCLWCDYIAVRDTPTQAIEVYRTEHEQPILDRDAQRHGLTTPPQVVTR